MYNHKYYRLHFVDFTFPYSCKPWSAAFINQTLMDVIALSRAFNQLLNGGRVKNTCTCTHVCWFPGLKWHWLQTACGDSVCNESRFLKGSDHYNSDYISRRTAMFNCARFKIWFHEKLAVISTMYNTSLRRGKQTAMSEVSLMHFQLISYAIQRRAHPTHG